MGISVITAVSIFGALGRYYIFLIQSGSMEPTIKMGSLVFVSHSEDYQVGDIVTFSSLSTTNLKDSSSLVTHRIVEAETKDNENRYLTKGDANQTADQTPISDSQVLGKVLLSIPLVGYPVAFAKTQVGFLALIIIPGTLIVYTEIMNILQEIKKIIAEHTSKKETANNKISTEKSKDKFPKTQKVSGKTTISETTRSKKPTKTQSIKQKSSKKKSVKKNQSKKNSTKLLLIIFFSLVTHTSSSQAILSDTEISSSNTISVGMWDQETPTLSLITPNEMTPNNHNPIIASNENANNQDAKLADQESQVSTTPSFNPFLEIATTKNSQEQESDQDNLNSLELAIIIEDELQSSQVDHEEKQKENTGSNCEIESESESQEPEKDREDDSHDQE